MFGVPGCCLVTQKQHLHPRVAELRDVPRHHVSTTPDVPETLCSIAQVLAVQKET